MVWTCHVKRPGVCKKKVMKMELLEKSKLGRSKRRFLDVVKEDMGEVGAREDIENRMLWRNIICCGNL